MFWNRFIEICKEKRTSPTAVVTALKISGGSVTKWKNGSIPTDTTILKLANYLDVSADYLLGISDCRALNDASAMFTDLTEQEKTLLRLFRDTTEEGRFEMIAAVMNIKNAIEKKHTGKNTTAVG